MKIGVSTAILWDYEKLDLPNAIYHSVEGLGYEAVEIHCEDPFFQGWGTENAETTKEEVEDVLSTLDTEVTLHAPYHDLNLASMNHRIQKEVIRQHKECIETAQYFGSEIIVVHPGYVSSRKFERKKPFQVMVENLKKITEAAEDAGVKICLENLASKKKAMCIGINEIKKVLNEVNKENLKLTLDIAHANTTKSGPLEFAEEFKDLIEHVHISDNTGANDHLTIGQGNIDFEKIISELQPYNGILMVEGWIPKNEDPFLSHDLSELKQIRKKLRNRK